MSGGSRLPDDAKNVADEQTGVCNVAKQDLTPWV
jgi:hypothetical protein